MCSILVLAFRTSSLTKISNYLCNNNRVNISLNSKIRFNSWSKSPLYFLPLYLLLFMSLAGVPAFEIARVVGVICIQFFTGLVFSVKLPMIGSKQVPLLIGSGITFGTSLSTFFHIFLRDTPIAQIAWLIPAGAALFWLFVDIRNKKLLPEIGGSHGTHPFLVGFVCTGLALADQWWWLYPILAIAIFAGSFRNLLK